MESRKYPVMPECLRKAGFKNYLLEDGLWLVTHVSEDGIQFLVYVKYDPSAGQLYCSGVFPGQWKSPKKMSRLYKFLQVANSGVLLGNFEYDEIKNEVYLRVSLYFGNEDIDEHFAILIIQTCLDGLAHYLPRVHALFSTSTDPVQIWETPQAEL